MEKLYTVSKHKNERWLRLRSWTLIAKLRLKLKKIGKTSQVWPKSNPLQLYEGSDNQIQWIRSDRQSAWWTVKRSLWHCTGGRDQDHPQEKEIQKGKMVVWGGLTNSCEKRSDRQRRKWKIHPLECRVPKNSKERKESLLQWPVQRNKGKQ